VRKIGSPTPDLQAARLLELLKADGGREFTVCREEICAEKIVFDGQLVRRLQLQASPAENLKDAIDVGLIAGGSLEVKGRGEGKHLVVGTTFSTVAVTRKTDTVRGPGQVTVESYRINLQDKGDNYTAVVTSLQLEKDTGGKFGSFIPLQEGRGKAAFMVVDKTNVGDYRYSIITFTSQWK
jgi:hypothetical protein